MGRSVLAVASGAILWAVLWIVTGMGIAAAAPDVVIPGEYIAHVGILCIFLAASVAYSLAAGFLTGVVATRSIVQHGFALGVLQLALGVAFQAQAWSLMPLWYHLTFLSLLLPGNVYGAWLAANRRRRAAAPA